MITVLVTNKEEKLKEIIARMINRVGNISICITKRGDVIEIMENEDMRKLVSLRDKVLELESSLYPEKKGMLYKAVLEVVEKPLLEYALERCEGNQLKAARMLGLNRNTIRSKIKKLGIDANTWKIS